MHRVHILYGQGGFLTSMGMNTFGRSLDAKRFDVRFWNWSDHRQVAQTISVGVTSKDSKIAIMGYSLGANACAWIANDITNKKHIDLLVAYDPTVNGPPLSQYPIGSNVKRAICYRQMGYIATSLMFGRGHLYSTPGGPKIEEVQVYADHLYVPYISALHERTRAALDAM
jgi:hypothetical protein